MAHLIDGLGWDAPMKLWLLGSMAGLGWGCIGSVIFVKAGLTLKTQSIFCWAFCFA